MTKFLSKLYKDAQNYGISGKEFTNLEKNIKTYNEWDRYIGEKFSELTDKASKLTEQTTQFNSKKCKSLNEGTSGLLCIAISLSTILTGAVLTLRVNMTFGAIITAVGCLGLAISLYQLSQPSLQNVRGALQHESTGKKLM